MTRRVYLLGVAAAILAAALAVNEGIEWRPSQPAQRRLGADQMLKRIEVLQRFERARTDIDKAYVEVAVAYAERMAGLATFLTTKIDDKTFLESIIRDRLAAAGPYEELRMTFGVPQVFEQGVRRHLVDLSFSTLSDRQALYALATLGIPEQGMAWDSFAVAADRQQKRITITGRLTALLIEPAE
jgi:hypothetical protein